MVGPAVGQQPLDVRTVGVQPLGLAVRRERAADVGPLAAEPLHVLRVRDRLRPVGRDEPAQEPVDLREADDQADLEDRVESVEQAAGSTHGPDSTHGSGDTVIPL